MLARPADDGEEARLTLMMLAGVDDEVMWCLSMSVGGAAG